MDAFSWMQVQGGFQIAFVKLFNELNWIGK